jgi:hypothetical protein
MRINVLNLQHWPPDDEDEAADAKKIEAPAKPDQPVPEDNPVNPEKPVNPAADGEDEIYEWEYYYEDAELKQDDKNKNVKKWIKNF